MGTMKQTPKNPLIFGFRLGFFPLHASTGGSYSHGKVDSRRSAATTMASKVLSAQPGDVMSGLFG